MTAGVCPKTKAQRKSRHALALVLDAAGRAEDARAAYAPIRRKWDEDRSVRQDPR
jgi:hypothetical protein